MALIDIYAKNADKSLFSTLDTNIFNSKVRACFISPNPEKSVSCITGRREAGLFFDHSFSPPVRTALDIHDSPKLQRVLQSFLSREGPFPSYSTFYCPTAKYELFKSQKLKL